MEKNILKIWTRVQNKDTAFSENDFIQFKRDFSEMIDDFWYRYKSFSLANMKRLVNENRALFDKLADILLYEPRFFSAQGICNWLLDVFETGEMPCAGKFVIHLSWNAEDVAPLAFLYVKDAQMRSWIAQHWNVCYRYRCNILWALHKEHVFDYNLFKVYNPHFIRKFALFVLLFGGLVGYICIIIFLNFCFW